MSRIVKLSNRLFRGRFGLIAIGLLLAGASAASSQDRDLAKLTPGDIAELYVAEVQGLVRVEAELDLVKRMTAALDQGTPVWDGSAGGTTAFAEGETEIRNLLTANVGQLADQVDEIEAKHLHDDIATLRLDWQKLRGLRNRWDLLNTDLEGGKVGSKWLALVGKDTRWFWLSAVFAVACLAFVSWHDRRHEYRRRMQGAKARAYGLTRLLKWSLYLLSVLTLVAFFGAEQFVGYLAAKPARASTRSIEDMDAEIRQVAEGRQTAEAELKQAKAEFETKRNDWFSAEKDERLRKEWIRLGDESRHFLVDLAVQDRLRSEIESDKVKLAALQHVISTNRAGIAELEALKWSVSGGVGLLLSVGVVGLGLWLLAGIQRRDFRTKHTCPMCTGFKTFQLDSFDSGNGISGDLPMLRCTGQIGDDQCPFEFRPFYQEMDKIYFPTLGIPQAGKTHWLAMLYRELNAGRYTDNVQFEKVEASSSQEFDALVRRIINSRINPGATQQEVLPHPLIFNFCDNDPWGKSNLLVNVFDYSGEVTQGVLASLSEMQRKRALKADGYLFFLDPTAPRDIQEEALNRFRRDLRVLGKVKANQSLRSPVALCLSKIDLLADHASPAFVDHFLQRLRQIDPTGQNITMEIIEERSKLTQELRDVIWPGWNIERLIHDLFGGRYMFFPLTPISLDNPDNLPANNLQDRQIDPFGIVEPLVWLLHMNGYPIMQEKLATE